MTDNRFAIAHDIRGVIFMAIGAGSMCWQSLSHTGVFDSGEAEAIGEEAVARITELLDEQKAPVP